MAWCDALRGLKLEDIERLAGPIATIIASIVAAVFAWRQGRVSAQQKEIAAEKLRLDLFDRRYAVFQSLFDYYEALVRWKGTEADKVVGARFFQACQQTRFLFDAEIESIFFELWRKGGQVTGFKEDGKAYMQQDPQLYREQSNLSQNTLLHVFDDRMTRLTEACKPYLDFRQVKRAARPQ